MAKQRKEIDIEVIEKVNQLYLQVKEVDEIIKDLDHVAQMSIEGISDIQLSINAIEKKPIAHEETPLLFLPGHGYFQPIDMPQARPVARVFLPEASTLAVVRAVLIERGNKKNDLLQEIQSLLK